MSEKWQSHDQENAVRPGLLSTQVQFLENVIAELFKHIKDLRTSVDEEISLARLRSRSEAALLLDASTDQVGRWTESGELSVVDLDRRPRYRLRDLEEFAAARIRRGRRLPKNAKAESSALPKHEKQNSK